MPRYELNIKGDIVETYYPDSFTRVDIVDTGEEYVYKVNPITLTEEEEELIRTTMAELAYILKPSELVRLRELDRVLRARNLDEKIIYFIEREILGYSWLEPLMRDERLEDIQCFQANRPIRVTHQDYGLMQTNIIPDEREVDRMVRILAYRGGMSIHRSRPVLDSVILPTGDRAALTYRGEVSPTSSFTIRKFPKHPWTPTRMLRTGMLSPEAMAFLWLCIEAKMPVIIFGEMGSGKTSLANALALLIKPTASIVLVQDVPEMHVPHDNVIVLSERRSLTLGGVGDITMEQLVAHALRRSVDYLIVNEVRYAEARAFAQYVATGHGGITSFHAGNLEEVYARFKSLGVDEATMASVRILIHTGRFLALREGRRVRLRRVREIYYIQAVKEYRPVALLAFQYDITKDALIPAEYAPALKEVAQRMMMDDEEVETEYMRRCEFMRLVHRLARADRYLEAGEWLELLKLYYRDPDSTISKLKQEVAELKIPEIPTEVRVQMPLKEPGKKCPHCERLVPPTAIVCPHCGRPLEGAPPSPAPAPPTPAPRPSVRVEEITKRFEQEMARLLEGLRRERKNR